MATSFQIFSINCIETFTMSTGLLDEFSIQHVMFGPNIHLFGKKWPKRASIISITGCFHPYLGKIPIFPNMFQMGWFNHQLDNNATGPKNQLFQFMCQRFFSPAGNPFSSAHGNPGELAMATRFRFMPIHFRDGSCKYRRVFFNR